jgi:hypothetical protein
MNKSEHSSRGSKPERRQRADVLAESRHRPSPLSKLQRLPRKFQEDLFNHNAKHSNDETVKWLARRGIGTSHMSVCRFRRWFHRRRLDEENRAFMRELIVQRRRDEPEVTEEELAIFGRKVFARLAIDQADGREWARQQMVRQREVRLEVEIGRLKLARHKFQFNAAAACLGHFAEIKAVVNSSGLTEPEKIGRIEQALFGRPSGKLQLSAPN